VWQASTNALARLLVVAKKRNYSRFGVTKKPFILLKGFFIAGRFLRAIKIGRCYHIAQFL
jgi:hypothetical protein